MLTTIIYNLLRKKLFKSFCRISNLISKHFPILNIVCELLYSRMQMWYLKNSCIEILWTWKVLNFQKMHAKKVKIQTFALYWLASTDIPLTYFCRNKKKLIHVIERILNLSPFILFYDSEKEISAEMKYNRVIERERKVFKSHLVWKYQM